MWLILKRYTILQDFFQLDSVSYPDDVMTTLKFDWSNLKILMSGRYRKLASSCVSFTIYKQCPGNIKGDVIPISLTPQNVSWETLKYLLRSKTLNLKTRKNKHEKWGTLECERRCFCKNLQNLVCQNSIRFSISQVA